MDKGIRFGWGIGKGLDREKGNGFKLTGEEV